MHRVVQLEFRLCSHSLEVRKDVLFRSPVSCWRSRRWSAPAPKPVTVLQYQLQADHFLGFPSRTLAKFPGTTGTEVGYQSLAPQTQLKRENSMVPKRLRGPAPVTRLISIVLLVATGLALAEGLNQEPSEDAVLPAEFRWAQRKDRILLTIELQVRFYRT